MDLDSVLQTVADQFADLGKFDHSIATEDQLRWVTSQ